MNKMLKLSTFLALGLAVVGTSSCGAQADITLWTGFGSSYTTALETLLDNYQAKSGVIVGHASQGGYDNLQSNINNSVATASFPNFANGYPDHFAGYIRSDILLPLDDYIDAYNLEHGGDLIADYYADYMTENQTLLYRADGEPYTMGLPFNKSTEVMAYNRTMLEFVNTIDNTIGTDVPETWAEMETLGAKVLTAMQSSDAFGKVVGADMKVYATPDAATAAGQEVVLDLRSVNYSNFRVFSWDSTANMFITLVRQWGSEYTSINESGQGYVQFYNKTNTNAERTVAMLEYWKDLYQSHIFGFPTDMGGTSDYSSDQLKAGNCMFTICSSGGLSYNIGGYGEVGIASIPYNVTNYAGEGEVARKYVISQGTSLALFDQGTAEQMQQAFDAIVYMTTGEAQGQWAVTTGYYPASKSATESTVYQNFLKAEPSSLDATHRVYQESSILNENTYMNEDAGWVKFVDPGFVGSSSIRTEVGYIMAQVFVGEMTIEQILENTYTTLSSYVPK